ncbi:glycosyltransferase family 2 protein [Gillisia limnaea]|uniref:Glycosyl transferase family 2 n=1 Tax=Gillisia limnaea (strain DSM 15749 / LMG 21470 / R-8282) TaxID=865937 RepID=H2BV84_GILLR|nr:glycosyltransferase family 2 protein [Gillisia limnaea]EHQ01749.1 glycosyl transferase family 2 [Gillisia limnaea DSM 15749]
MPLISIITVNLNNLEGLERTMNSVFEQTWQEYEYIVIDGGSTDGSKEYIEQHSDRIDFWASEKDSGIYNAMNKGIKVATGRYLLFLNSGDQFYSKYVLDRNFKFLKIKDIIYFNVQVEAKDSSTLISYPTQLRFSDLLYGTLCHQSVFIKYELFQKVGLYDETLKIVSDWKFIILALFKENCTSNKIDDILTIVNTDGISAMPENDTVIIEERNNVLNNHFSAFLIEVQELYELKSIVRNLKKSRKINLLIKLGLLNKF